MSESLKLARTFLGKIVKVQVDRPLGSIHPKHDFKYQLNYGFISDTLAPDGAELDAYILGQEEPLTEFTGKCIAIIHRKDDDDDKLIVAPEGVDFTDEDIMKMTHFQEQWFESEVIRQ